MHRRGGFCEEPRKGSLPYSLRSWTLVTFWEDNFSVNTKQYKAILYLMVLYPTRFLETNGPI